MRRLAALALVLLLAGCTRPPAAEPEPEPAYAVPVAADPAPLLLAFAAPVPRLPVTLDVPERWVRPADTVHANATAHATSFEWYLANRNPRAPGPSPTLALAPDSPAAALDVRRPGRHAFALDGSHAQLNVSIVPGALALRLDARIVDDGTGARFAPDELIGGSGSLVRLVNERDAPALIRRVASMSPLPADGPRLTFRMQEVVPELGDYEIVVVARDGGGAVGQAAERIVYDNRKPDPEQRFGPWRGEFLLPPLPDAPPREHGWKSAHPLRSLDVRFTSSSDAPPPSGVRITLLGPEHEPLASAEADGFSLADLPPGEYRFVVEHLGGVAVAYELDAHGVWELSPPASFFRG